MRNLLKSGLGCPVRMRRGLALSLEFAISVYIGNAETSVGVGVQDRLDDAGHCAELDLLGDCAEKWQSLHLENVHTQRYLLMMFEDMIREVHRFESRHMLRLELCFLSFWYGRVKTVDDERLIGIVNSNGAFGD
jgi:hypothetical protein